MNLSRCFLALVVTSSAAFAQNLNYVQKNLVADTAGVADNTDPNLKGLWGISASPTSPFWVSNAFSGTATIYNGTTGVPATTVVAIPAGAASTVQHGTPTGQVNNGTAGFLLNNGTKASFIFATVDGMIAAWNGGTTAEVRVDNSAIGASYTGLAIGIGTKGPMLYVADINFGHIDVFDTNFNEIASPGGFIDTKLPAGLSPFNIQRFGRNLIVTYAVVKKDHYTNGPGTGAVNLFDLDGHLISRLATGGALNAPWGLAIAPNQFGTLSYTLLVGNFGDGRINAYDLLTDSYIGFLKDASGAPLVIPGLWGLQFGSGTANGGDAEALYFAADVDGTHGLFGSLKPAADSVQP
jgi:uncharacterized protein (TIGR03118 family)